MMNIKEHRYAAITLYDDGLECFKLFSDLAEATAFARDVAERDGADTFVYSLADGGEFFASKRPAPNYDREELQPTPRRDPWTHGGKPAGIIPFKRTAA